MVSLGFIGAALVIGFVVGILVGRKNAGLVEKAVEVGKTVAADAQAAADKVKQ